MIDFYAIEKYKENNRIEAKRALGGLPKSIWETYSAFANTLGGIILLGVEEHKDKSLHPVDLPCANKLIDEFITLLNDKNKVSVNILTKNDISIQEIKGKKIIVISVPRAQFWEMPVYIDKDPLYSTYVRNGEGDYRLPPEQVKKLINQANTPTQDSMLSNHGENVLNKETFEAFNLLCNQNSTGGDVLSLLKQNDKLTNGALLVLGEFNAIKSEFPNYKIALNGIEIKENLFDFYLNICRYLSSFNFENSVIQCFAEAVINAITNNDFTLSGGISININSDFIEFSNSGKFKISFQDALEGGVSSQKNPLISKILSLAFNTNRLGSGIPNMFKVWQDNSWSAPVFKQESNRVYLTLYFHKTIDLISNPPFYIYKDTVIEFLTDRIFASISDIAQLLNIGLKEATQLLEAMPHLVIQTKENPQLYKLKDR